MTLYRIWWTLCTLPEGTSAQDLNSAKPVRYKRKRNVEDVEAESEAEVVSKIVLPNHIPHDRLKVKNGLGELVPARKQYADIFAICPARDGEKVREIEGSWSATEEMLFSEAELEACKQP